MHAPVKNCDKNYWLV